MERQAMQSVRRLPLLLLFLALVLSANTFGQSNREQMEQMIQQLQRSPEDKDLRARIIRLAVAFKPAPTIPEEAERRLARGEAAFERAKDPGDYANAVREFRAAVAAAPWLAAAYFNLGVTEEKSDHPSEAIEAFRWYLLAAPDAKDAPDVRKRIFKLEYASEHKREAVAASARQTAISQQEQRVVGDWRRRPATPTGAAALEILHVRRTPDRKLTFTYDMYLNNQQTGKELPWNVRDAVIRDGELRFESIWTDSSGVGTCAAYDVRGTVSQDGHTLTLAYTLLPYAADRPDTCPLKKYYGSHVDSYTR
jgi:tetratricopeptide (TPR) repeat protein